MLENIAIDSDLACHFAANQRKKSVIREMKTERKIYHERESYSSSSER